MTKWPQDNCKTKNTVKWYRFLGIALFAAVLYKVDLSMVADQMLRIPVVGIALAAGVCIAVLCGKALRWFLLLKECGCRIELRSSLNICAISQLCGMLTPGRVGELVRVAHLKKNHDISLVSGTALVLLDRVFDFIAMGIALAAVLFSNQDLLNISPAGRYVIAGTCLVGLFGIPLIARYVHRWIKRLPAGGEKFFELTAHIGNIKSLQVLVFVTISLMNLAFYIFMVYEMTAGLTVSPDLVQTAVCVIASMAVAIVPISFFNLGSREVVLIGLFNKWGYSSNDAVAFSMLFMVGYLLQALTSWLIIAVSKGREKE
jgi:uncharacterized protein (TIRG00374 family)